MIRIRFFQALSNQDEEEVGHNVKENHGGKLVKEFLKSGDYVLLNETTKSHGGPYTRYAPEDPDDEERKSMLDPVIMLKDLFKYVVRLEIDKDLHWTPYRSVNKRTLRFTDHYAMLLVIKNIPKMKKKRKP